MATRSAKLYSGTPAAGVRTLAFTVPAGYTYIFKNSNVTKLAGASESVYIAIVDGGGSEIRPTNFPSGFNIGFGGGSDWEVLVPGDSMYVYSSLGDCAFWLSGTKLPGTAP